MRRSSTERGQLDNATRITTPPRCARLRASFLSLALSLSLCSRWCASSVLCIVVSSYEYDVLRSISYSQRTDLYRELCTSSHLTGPFYPLFYAWSCCTRARFRTKIVRRRSSPTAQHLPATQLHLPQAGCPSFCNGKCPLGEDRTSFARACQEC